MTTDRMYEMLFMVIWFLLNDVRFQYTGCILRQKLKTTVCFRSGCRLLATGQLRHATRISSFCFSVKLFFGKCSSTITSATRRGLLAMILVMSIAVPSMENPCSCAAIPAMVIIQLPRDVASRSVGEKASPRPLLSNGASVTSSLPDFTCTALVLSSPMYSGTDRAHKWDIISMQFTKRIKNIEQ